MNDSPPLSGLIDIITLTHRLQSVKRIIFATGEDRFENDAEHSFQLAFVAWYLMERGELPLDKGKVLMYALCHDLTEVHTGDVSFYRTKEEDLNKKEREEEAIEKLKESHPDFPLLAETISAYERRVDEESKFVYALDKILPILNIMLDKGRSWNHLNISFEMLCEGKRDRVSCDPTVQSYFVLIVEMLKENLHLFPKRT